MGKPLRSKATPDDREAELSVRHLPEPDGRTWLAALVYACAVCGTLVDDALEVRKSSMTARALTWRDLLVAGYSYPEIARGWCVDTSTVRASMVRYYPEAVTARTAEHQGHGAHGPGLARCAPPVIDASAWERTA